MTHLFRVVLSTGLAIASFGCGREMYLSCSLTGPDNNRKQYSFAFDPERGTLFWVEGTQKLEVSRNTSTQLSASHEVKFHDFAYDMTHFRLNLVTGAAEISYSRKPSSAEVASCKKERNWGCEDYLVLTEKSENGTCNVTDRAIK